MSYREAAASYQSQIERKKLQLKTLLLEIAEMQQCKWSCELGSAIAQKEVQAKDLYFEIDKNLQANVHMMEYFADLVGEKYPL